MQRQSTTTGLACPISLFCSLEPSTHQLLLLVLWIETNKQRTRLCLVSALAKERNIHIVSLAWGQFHTEIQSTTGARRKEVLAGSEQALGKVTSELVLKFKFKVVR